MSEESKTLDNAMKLADRMSATFMQSIEDYKNERSKDEREALTYQMEAVVVHSVAMFVLICFLNQSVLNTKKLEETFSEVKKFVKSLLKESSFTDEEIH